MRLLDRGGGRGLVVLVVRYWGAADQSAAAVAQRALLLGIIGAWGAAMALLAVVPSTVWAVLVFALGGLIYAPCTPVAYMFVQSLLSAGRIAPQCRPPYRELGQARFPWCEWKTTVSRTARLTALSAAG